MKCLLRSVLLSTGIAALLLAAACSREPATGDAGYSPTTPPSSVKPGFINKVWEVSLSTGVSPGMLYAFLSDGTLVITSPNSKAAFGAWTYKNGQLTMIEGSQEYKTDILNLSHDELRLRSHNPGGSVEIVLVPARVAPLPP
ncbi:MAG: hypothetical protein Q8M51_13185 [Polaromonas sp.]|uniref:hypothetical protein n=1 Tax=Polaromonas sp. TaxID=1869339 RepID=UPI00272EEE37|nr:hypothetical protein [Polaromonas sp.]MDP1741546.1 hypothetical protein [Polaromonas sp.]MDP2035700.1 hypothetical protein [Polaromonas sp.]MDP3356797.1 hypothetical protein [Polaromonas sp.]MDP3753733.1 hypothetical protein [Polaromonas sp.]